MTAASHSRFLTHSETDLAGPARPAAVTHVTHRARWALKLPPTFVPPACLRSAKSRISMESVQGFAICPTVDTHRAPRSPTAAGRMIASATRLKEFGSCGLHRGEFGMVLERSPLKIRPSRPVQPLPPDGPIYVPSLSYDRHELPASADAHASRRGRFRRRAD